MSNSHWNVKDEERLMSVSEGIKVREVLIRDKKMAAGLRDMVVGSVQVDDSPTRKAQTSPSVAAENSSHNGTALAVLGKVQVPVKFGRN